MLIYSYFDGILDWLQTEGVKVLLAIVLVIIAFIVINFLCKIIKSRVIKRGYEEAKVNFLVKLLSIVLKICVILLTLGFLGVATTGLVALFGTLGLALGLAIQGSLANFAGGIIIIFTKPFRKNDFIETNGQSGSVEEIRFFYTVLQTVDNKVVHVPNGALANNVIVNYSAKEFRRLDLVFSIAYENDFETAKKVLEGICDEHYLILKEPAKFVRVTSHSESSIDLTVRVWVKTEDYFTVNFDLLEKAKKEFDKNGIEIPYTKIDVNLNK